MDRAGRVLGLADRAGPEPCARSVADGVIERGADDRDVDATGGQLGRIGDPGQVHERRRADIGRQVEVIEDLVPLHHIECSIRVPEAVKSPRSCRIRKARLRIKP